MDNSENKPETKMARVLKLSRRYLTLLTSTVCILCALLALLIVLLLYVTYPREPKISAESVNLRLLVNAINTYRIDHGKLPLESHFKESMEQYLTDTSILSQARYFCDSKSFVLIAPGANKKFDTPEGYNNLNAFETQTDDTILFWPVPKGHD